MRTIDTLPIANQAPLIDPCKRREVAGNAIALLGMLISLATLSTLVAIASGTVDRDVLPFATASIAIGCGISAFGARLRRNAWR